MLIRKTVGNTWVEFRILSETVERLSKTCFRGKDQKFAGNFFRWESLEEFFKSRYVVGELIADLWRSKLIGHQTVEIECPVTVGWTSTAPLHQYPLEAIEKFNPNKRSMASRIKLDRTAFKAPMTNYLTITYQLKVKEEGLDVIIWTIYPGHDVGELRGNVTARENCVFFDWNHPGA